MGGIKAFIDLGKSINHLGAVPELGFNLSMIGLKINKSYKSIGLMEMIFYMMLYNVIKLG